MSDVLIIQRFYYNFREGFFDYLSETKFSFKLINSTRSRGRVIVNPGAEKKNFFVKTFSFPIGDNHVIFPFLFFRIIQLNPRIIVTEGGQNTINNLQVFLYCLLFRKEYIIWDLGKAYSSFGNSLTRRLYMSVYKHLIRHAKYIFGYNSQSKEYFKSLGIKDCKIVILNNTIDTRRIKKIRSTKFDELPVELQNKLSHESIKIIFVGSLIRSKNIERMAELMKIIGEKYCLMIAGDGEPQYKIELEKLFHGTNHIFLGYKNIEQLAPFYKLATFSILPGLGGLSINQSMAFGVPVICHSADGAEQDLVFKDETGYIYKDIEDACNYIKSKTLEDWEKMGINSESLLFSNFSVEKMMEKFIFYSNYQ